MSKIKNFKEEQKKRKRRTGYIIIHRPVIFFYEEIGTTKYQEFNSDNEEDVFKSILNLKVKDGRIRIVCDDDEERDLLEKDFEEIRKSQKIKLVGDLVEFKKGKV